MNSKAMGFAILAVLLGFSMLTAPKSSAQTKITLTQPVNSLAFLPVYVGRSLGYFKAEGIDLKVIATAGGGPHLQAVVAGEAQFSASPGTYQLAMLSRGRKIISVFNILDRNIIGVVIHKDAARENGITEHTPFYEKLKKMKGLKIGYSRPGSLTYMMAEDLIKRGGYTPNKEVKMVTVGGPSSMIPALRARKVDILLVSTPHPERTIADGFGMWFINSAKGEDPNYQEFLMSALMVQPSYAEEHPEVVRSMVRAMRRSVNFIVSRPLEEVVEAVKPYFGKMLSPAVLSESVRTVKSTISASGRVSERALKITLKLMIQGGKRLRAVTIDDVFTDKYLN